MVLVLGVRQFQLTRKYTEITELSERTLFTFATLREQVSESLISREPQLLKSAIPEIEVLNNTITKLYDSEVIPGQYKLAMSDRIDLAGLVIDLRKMGLEQNNPEMSLKLQKELRIIADNLFKIDRVITGQIRNSIVSFQLSMIGAMGLLISCISFVLILLYRRAIKPIMDLSLQITDDQSGFTPVVCDGEAGAEVIEITDSINRLMKTSSSQDTKSSPRKDENHEVLSTTVNETTNGLNGMINYAQLLLESDSDLSAEQARMLEQIIESGERVAGQWQKISQRFSD